MINKFIRMMKAFRDALIAIMEQIAKNLETETARREALKKSCSMKKVIRHGKTYCSNEALKEIENNVDRVMQLGYDVLADTDITALIFGLDALIEHVKNTPSRKDADDFVLALGVYVKRFELYTDPGELDTQAILETIVIRAKMAFVPGYEPDPVRFQSGDPGIKYTDVDDGWPTEEGKKP